MMKKQRAINIILITLLLLVLSGGKTQASGYTYSYDLAVTINSSQVDETLTDFPIYLTGTIEALATTANGGDINNTDGSGGASGSLTVPADFAVGTATDCNTLLDFEFENYNAATGDYDLWVKIPSLSDTEDTTIYFCWGSTETSTQEAPAGVWDNNYIAVWHMAEASGTFYDSTGNYNAADHASSSDKTGKVGPGQYFDGDDYYEVSANAAFADRTATISVWYYHDSTDTGDHPTVLDNSDEVLGNGFNGWMFTDRTKFQTRKYDLSSVKSYLEGTADDEWIMATATIDLVNGTQELFNSGVSDDVDTPDVFTPDTNTIQIGRGIYDTWFDCWKGYIDEIEFSSVIRSDGWISTTANNQSAPGDFVTYGDVEGPPPVIIVGNSSYSGVPSSLKTAIETALDTYRPDSDLELENIEMANMWAITNYSESLETDYYWVSLVGLKVPDPEELDGWDLSMAIWSGIAIAEDTSGTETAWTAHVAGSAGYDVMVDAAGLADISRPDSGGSGSASYFFPWAAGYSAYYGSKGVHGAGPADPAWGGVGWKAVDWVGGATGFTGDIFPNGAFVSMSGSVNYVCRDNIQTWVQIGNFLYGHLVDNNTLREGIYHSQGSYLAALVTGTHLTPTHSTCVYDGPTDAKCGYMCQGPTHYHLHWGFIPDGYYFNTEGWILNTQSEEWVKGAQSVGPGEYMLAQWGSIPDVPTPGPTITPGGPTPTPGAPIPVISEGGGGGQIWDGFIAGMKKMVDNRVQEIRDLGDYGDNLYEDRHLIYTLMSGIRIGIRTLYVMVSSSINMTITLVVFLIIIVMEPVRLTRALWMAIKGIIPFIG